MSRYTKERAELTAHLETVTEQIADLMKETDNATRFVELAEQYADIKELDWDLLHRLMDRIEIGESCKEDAHDARRSRFIFGSLIESKSILLNNKRTLCFSATHTAPMSRGAAKT